MNESTKKIISFFSILGLGILFGITLTKGEIVSWFRIQEMFRFQSFHMYCVIGTAIFFGIIINQIFHRVDPDTFEGHKVKFSIKQSGVIRYIVGGIIFGMGWAMTGACPGPLYALIGSGYTVILMALLGGILGTFTYGLLREKLPH